MWENVVDCDFLTMIDEKQRLWDHRGQCQCLIPRNEREGIAQRNQTGDAMNDNEVDYFAPR